MPPIDLHTLHAEDATKMQERMLSAAWLYLDKSRIPFPSQRKLKMQQKNNKSSILKRYLI